MRAAAPERALARHWAQAARAAFGTCCTVEVGASATSSKSGRAVDSSRRWSGASRSSAAWVGAVVPGRHQQATLTAHVEVMGAQVLGRNSAAERTRAMLVQVMPHALVRSPATGALGVAKQAPRHGAEAADRLGSLRNPLPTPRSPIPISSRWRTDSGRRPGRIAGRRPRMSGFPDSHACIATSAPKSTREQTSMAMPAQAGNRPGPEARQGVPAFQGSLSPDLVQASCQESPALATEPGQARKARRILAGWIGRAASCVHMCGRRARSGEEEKRQHGRRQQAADDGHISRGRPWRRRTRSRRTETGFDATISGSWPKFPECGGNSFKDPQL